MRDALKEVLQVATPLMISTGMFSLVLFIDRTFLLWHEPSQMGASFAAGNLFWVTICVFVGIASMTGSIVSQYIGANQHRRVGRLLWQSVWFSLATFPLFIGVSHFSKQLFVWTGQPESLIPMEAAYFGLLMWGGTGEVLQTALSGFFSGIHRTRTVMIVSVVSGILNLALDAVLIFGVDPAWWGGDGERVLELGIVGAGIASCISFWFKAFCYGGLILLPRYRRTYGILKGICWDRSMAWRLVYFGTPAGLMYVTEAGAFAAIVLQVGQLGDVPLQATTMAINFNMIAFVPLVGVSIAASVLVGQHLIRSGAERAMRSVWAALIVAWVYSVAWAIAYVLGAEFLVDLYAITDSTESSEVAFGIAEGLLGFVAIYVVLDATQLVLAGTLRGAGDTWFVLLAGLTVSVVVVTIGMVGQPNLDELSGWKLPDTSANVEPTDPSDGTSDSVAIQALHWWWWILTGWVASLACAMLARFWHGKWRHMRMV